MAPEQAAGRKDQLSEATDVYALGAILYEMLTGKPPFRGETPLDTLRQVMSEDPVAPTKLAQGIPVDLEAICLKCLEKSPAARYPSAHELDEDLRRFLNGQPVRARRSGRVRKSWKWVRRHPQLVSVSLALAILVTLSAVFWIDHNRIRGEQDRRGELEMARIKQKAQREVGLVREILQRHCYECHYQDSGFTKIPLDILDYHQLINSDRKIVVTGDPESSRLIKRIRDGSMPPEEEETRLPRLTEEELTILRDWVQGGAPPFPTEDPTPPTPPVVPYSALAERTMGIFQEYCYKCHKFDVHKGGIKILNYRQLVTEKMMVVPGRPDESELYRLIVTDDKLKMPPREEKQLPPEDIATIREWIEQGVPPFPKRQ
jgi:hypothetical protein